MSKFTYLKNIERSFVGENRMVFENEPSGAKVLLGITKGSKLDEIKEGTKRLEEQAGKEAEILNQSKKNQARNREEIDSALSTKSEGEVKSKEATEVFEKFTKNKDAIKKIITTFPKYKKGFWRTYILPAMKKLGITEKDIRTFQKENKLKIDGLPGPQTLNALAKMFEFEGIVKYAKKDEDVDETGFYTALDIQNKVSSVDNREIAEAKVPEKTSPVTEVASVTTKAEQKEEEGVKFVSKDKAKKLGYINEKGELILEKKQYYTWVDQGNPKNFAIKKLSDKKLNLYALPTKLKKENFYFEEGILKREGYAGIYELQENGSIIYVQENNDEKMGAGVYELKKEEDVDSDWKLAGSTATQIVAKMNEIKKKPEETIETA